MHPLAAEKILESVRLRERQGDYPTEVAYSRETLEGCLIEIAQQRDRLRVPPSAPDTTPYARKRITLAEAKQGAMEGLERAASTTQPSGPRYQGAWRWNEDKTAKLMSAEDWLEAEARVDEMLDSGKDRGGVMRAIAEEMRQIRTRLTAQAVPPSAPDTPTERVLGVQYTPAEPDFLAFDHHLVATGSVGTTLTEASLPGTRTPPSAPDTKPDEEAVAVVASLGSIAKYGARKREREAAAQALAYVRRLEMQIAQSSSPPEGEDTQRLDWLEERTKAAPGQYSGLAIAILSDDSFAVGEAASVGFSGWADGEGPTLRDAIDSARAAIPPQKT